jgi:hypothetical protein
LIGDDADATAVQIMPGRLQKDFVAQHDVRVRKRSRERALGTGGKYEKSGDARRERLFKQIRPSWFAE